jgi:hypothetical protein
VGEPFLALNGPTRIGQGAAGAALGRPGRNTFDTLKERKRPRTFRAEEREWDDGPL